MTTRLQKGLLGDFPILYRFFLLRSRRKYFHISLFRRTFALRKRKLNEKVLNISTLLIINKERRLVMKKMLLSLIAITMLSTGTTFAQRRSGNRENVRIESRSPRGGQSYNNTPARDINRGHRGPATHVVHHGPAVHHAPVVHHPIPFHHRPFHHRPHPHHIYHERVIVAPAPVAYPCPPPPPAPVVVVEPAPAPVAITIGALAGAIIGGTIAAAASR